MLSWLVVREVLVVWTGRNESHGRFDVFTLGMSWRYGTVGDRDVYSTMISVMILSPKLRGVALVP